MRKYILTPLLLSVLAGCASGRGGDRPVSFAKNPTVILAQDIAQSRAAQEDGPSKALSETAADAAVTFVPELVLDAKAWFKPRPKTAGARKWQPHSVVMSCDGKTGVTTGAWQQTDRENGMQGYYTTVWNYSGKPGKTGKWRWLLHHIDRLDAPRAEPEFLQTKTASCKGEASVNVTAPPEGVQMKQGFSRDQTLSWVWQYRPDKSRYLSVSIWNGNGWEKIFSDNVKPR